MSSRRNDDLADPKSNPTMAVDNFESDLRIVERKAGSKRVAEREHASRKVCDQFSDYQLKRSSILGARTASQ